MSNRQAAGSGYSNHLLLNINQHHRCDWTVLVCFCSSKDQHCYLRVDPLNTTCIDHAIQHTCVYEKYMSCGAMLFDCCVQESPALKPLVGEWLSQIPAGRLAEVTDLQAAIVFLASEASSYMTGHNLGLEGGQSLW